jgi:HPt (histidine-containing phosphotransfer) domain-containing protein
MFCKDTQERLAILQKPPTETELSAFITQVHALKSASSSIGATEISKEASRLEIAGIGSDLNFIRENLPAFAKFMTELVKKINDALPLDNKTEIETDISVYIPIFNELATALKFEKISDIDRILHELEQKISDSKTKEILEQISDYVLMTEFGSAIKIIDELLQQPADKE